MTLREARLINGTLTNSEVWPDLTQKHQESIEAADLDLMRKIFNAHSKTASELFYLETGKIPLRFVIYKRRQMYLWQILTRNDGELIHKVYSVQRLQTTRGDWFQIINEVKEKLAIEKSDEEISSMKKETFKAYMDKKTHVAAFEYLKKMSRKHSKSEFTWSKSVFEQEKYLSDARFSKQEIQLLFRLRTRMTDVKSNFRNQYQNNMDCQTCKETCIEDENHLLVCENLKDEESVKTNFSKVYGSIEDQLQIVKVFKKILRKRETILDT